MEIAVKSAKVIFSLIVPAMLTTACGNNGSETRFNLIDLPDEKKVEVWIDDALFTSYIYPDHHKKPVLFPIKTASGKVITRSFPFDTIPGEHSDHIHHAAIRSIQGRDDSGSLDVVNEWRAPDGSVLLEAYTRFIFSAPGASRMIDRITTLQALNQEVIFKDNKEGMLAVGVVSALELPLGNYLSSEGLEGEEVWGTRARWMKLYGTMEDEKVSIIIFDHPDNVGYPACWQNRGDGLISANPLGQSVFQMESRCWILNWLPMNRSLSSSGY